MNRLKIHLHPHCLRFTEVRWMGKRIQWVVSPVQIAFWTHMDQPMPNLVGQRAPVRRWRPMSMTDA